MSKLRRVIPFLLFVILNLFILFFIFKTGGWSILLSMLDIDKKPEQQGYAALAIATAVEDNCDFQMMFVFLKMSKPNRNQSFK